MSRIGIDYTSAIRQSAGIGRYTRNLIAALADIDRMNNYVLFSGGRIASEESWPPNFCTRSVPLTDRHLAILWQRLRLPLPVELLTGKLDIYHSPDFVLPPVWRARTALTVHDLSFLRHPECSSPPLLNYLLGNVPRSIGRADAILADSQNTRDDLIDLLHVPPDRVHVVYPGVEERFSPERDESQIDEVVRRYQVRRPFILGVGTLQPRKNFPRLMRAFDLLRQERAVPHQLVIAGVQGWLSEEIQETLSELDLGDDIRLTGFVADEDLPDLYRAADLFAFPSLYEGFGIPVLEAMGCGTPVVTSNVSSLPEVAGDAALLVPPEDVQALAEAMWRLVDDDALRVGLRLKGYQLVNRFTWPQAAKRLLSVYQELL